MFTINTKTLTISNNCKLTEEKQIKLQYWVRKNFHIINQYQSNKIKSKMFFRKIRK